MHFLLTALGSYGDVYPMIGLGAALRRRRHAVTLVTNPYFAADVAAAGLELAPLATAEEYEALTRDRALWGRTSGMSLVLRKATLGLLRPLDGILRERCRPGETVLAAHGLDFASRVFAERTQTPAVSIVYAPVALWSYRQPPRLPAGPAWPGAPRWLHRGQFAAGAWMLRRLVGREIDEFRQEQGLPRVGGRLLEWYYEVAPALALFPDWFVSPDGVTPTDWPRGAVTTGFPLGDGAAGRDAELDPHVERFLDAGEPPIVFTPGSAMRHGARFFAAATRCCALLGRRGVLLTRYPEQVPRPLPPTVLAPGFTPMARLLERSAALVHHGGIGSSARGLAAGVPQLVQPIGFDQFDNAWRLRRLGVADELPATRFTAARAAAKLDRLLTSVEVADATRRWRPRCDAAAALDSACDELERRATA